MWTWFIGAALAAPPLLDTPVRTGETNDADAALVVGNETYAGLPTVPHAHHDATVFADWLVHTRGVPAPRVLRRDDATIADLEKALAEAAGLVGPAGTLWVYFAGHGGVDGGRILLGTGSGGLPVARLTEVAGSAAQAVVVVDAGFGGVGRSGLDSAGGTRFEPGPWPTPPGQVVLWAATEQAQIAPVLPQADHGLFTYLVVGALRGWADGHGGTPDGTVTLGEAQGWVATAVPALDIRTLTPTTTGPPDWPLSGGAGLERPPDLATLLDRKAGLVAGTTANRDGVVAELEALGIQLEGFSGPFERVSARTWNDQNDKPVAFPEIRTIASVKEKGQRAIDRLERNALVQGLGALIGAAAGGAAGYCATGDGPDWCSVALPAGAVVGGIGFAVPISGAGRGKIKTEVVDVANEVLSEAAH